MADVPRSINEIDCYLKQCQHLLFILSRSDPRRLLFLDYLARRRLERFPLSNQREDLEVVAGVADMFENGCAQPEQCLRSSPLCSCTRDISQRNVWHVCEFHLWLPSRGSRLSWDFDEHKVDKRKGD